MKKTILQLSMVTIMTTASLFANSAQEIIDKNGCMSCHNIMGMKDAPPFAGIAWRTSRWGANSKNVLINSIKNGSTGKYPMFSSTKMPAFSNLSDKELNTLATWIMNQSSNMNGMGKCGMKKCGSNMNNNNTWW